MKKLLLFTLLLLFNFTYGQVTVDFPTIKDNTIYSENSNANALGSIYAGRNAMGNNRRGLLEFDLSAIPNNVLITEVTLMLNISQVSSSTNDEFSLHKLTKAWGEGSSFGGGSGSAAIAPDATWIDAMLGTETWTTPGGDFEANASATEVFPNSVGMTAFASTSELISDVQSWLDDPSQNFGWILIGDEVNANSTRRFDSKDQGSTPPVLRVTYVELETAMLVPVKDNTIYSESTNSNGQGRLFAGQNSQGNNRRALLQFDLSSIPSSSNINSVSVVINIDQLNTGNSHEYSLHRLTKDWGEGTSNGAGSGATAVAPDATWQDAMLGTSSWDTPGGDFIGTPSATELFPSALGSVTITSSSNLVSDVQNWLDGNEPNFGWILIGDESTSNTTRRFDSRENTGNEPMLVITYSSSLGIDEQSLSTFNVYPNPSETGIFNITSTSAMKDLKIYDISGKVLKVVQGLDITETSLDLSIFNTGIYLLEVTDANGFKKVNKIIKN